MLRNLPARRSAHRTTYGVASTGGASQNGWPASSNPAAIDIVTVAVPLRNGTKNVQVTARVADAMTEMIQWWDRNIEPVESLGGYNYREIRGYEDSGKLSNHASGTAIDINASKHPLGATGTVSTTQAAMITAKAATLGLRWGGDYRNRKDEMHLEVVFSPTTEMLREKVVNYWWLGAISATALVGALIYRRRFRS